jgi:uncharacterized membrane protein
MLDRRLFLSRLREGLWGLPSVLIDDIVGDYECHFAEGLARGRHEQDVISALGDPDRLACELWAVSRTNPAWLGTAEKDDARIWSRIKK